MNYLDAQKAVARKLDIDFDNISLNGLFSLTDLKEYILDAALEAWDYAFWDVSEHSKTATLAALDVSNGYIPYPPEYVPNSIYILHVDGKEHSKRHFKDFLKTFQDDSTSQKKVWAEHKKLIFLNTNLIAVDTVVDVWGKLVLPPLSADADLMPFSPTTDANDLSGNNAIVTLAYAKALSSEKKRNPQQGAIEEKRAYGILEKMKDEADQGKSSEQPTRPMFDVPNMFPDSRSNGGNASIGTFSI